MEVIRFNTKKKAERCILAGRNTHRLHWQEYFFHDKEGFVAVNYLVFYTQKGDTNGI